MRAFGAQCRICLGQGGRFYWIATKGLRGKCVICPVHFVCNLVKMKLNFLIVSF